MLLPICQHAAERGGASATTKLSQHRSRVPCCPAAPLVQEYAWFGGAEAAEWRVGELQPSMFPSLPGTLTRKPLAVLVNGSTASAAEVLAGALRDNGRQALDFLLTDSSWKASMRPAALLSS